MVKVPVRGDVAVFAAMENATVPLPLPLAPAVIVSQVALLVAVQVQPVAVVTVALLVPATAVGLSEVGDTVKEHEENVNVFDGSLRELPPGPTAETVDV